MNVLPKEYSKKGFTYLLIERNDKAAIYLQMFGEQRLAFEVMKVVVAKPYQIAGKDFPGGESLPSDEAFGSWAWSFAIFNSEESAKKGALDKFNEITTYENLRQERSSSSN